MRNYTSLTFQIVYRLFLRHASYRHIWKGNQHCFGECGIARLYPDIPESQKNSANTLRKALLNDFFLTTNTLESTAIAKKNAPQEIWQEVIF